MLCNFHVETCLSYSMLNVTRPSMLPWLTPLSHAVCLSFISNSHFVFDLSLNEETPLEYMPFNSEQLIRGLGRMFCNTKFVSTLYLAKEVDLCASYDVIFTGALNTVYTTIV